MTKQFALISGTIVAFISSCSICFSSVEYRTFTDTQGRNTKARITKLDSRTVTLEKENREKVSVPLNVFCEQDQLYFKDWLVAQDFLSSSELKIDIKKQKKAKSNDTSGIQFEHSLEGKPLCVYGLSLASRSENAIANVTLEYCVYIMKECLRGNSEDEHRVIGGTSATFSIPAKGKYELETVGIHTFEYIEQGTTQYTNEDGSLGYESFRHKHFEDEIEGAWFRLSMRTSNGNIFIREFGDPTSVMSDYSWDDNAIKMIPTQLEKEKLASADVELVVAKYRAAWLGKDWEAMKKLFASPPRDYWGHRYFLMNSGSNQIEANFRNEITNIEILELKENRANLKFELKKSGSRINTKSFWLSVNTEGKIIHDPIIHREK